MSKYLLQKSTTQDGWWTLTDTDAGIVCRFKEHEFNESQKFTPLDSDKDVIAKYGVSGLAKICADMGAWARAYHYNIIMPTADITERLRIGMIVRYHREQHGMTVRELAEKSGVSYQNITKIENGKYNVSIDILSRITSALGVELSIQ